MVCPEYLTPTPTDALADKLTLTVHTPDPDRFVEQWEHLVGETGFSFSSIGLSDATAREAVTVPGDEEDQEPAVYLIIDTPNPDHFAEQWEHLVGKRGFAFSGIGLGYAVAIEVTLPQEVPEDQT